jgi:uncharacterized membrane protein
MTRADFMARLRRGLAGMPAAAIEDIAADYDTHFADAQAAGRSEQEVADALGGPDRLARELRAEAGMKRWDEERTPAAARGALWGLLGLGAIDLIIVFWVLFPVIGVLFAVLAAVIATFVGGVAALAVGPFMDPPGGPTTAILIGIGVMATSTSIGALLGLVSIGLVNLLVWYVRLHLRLLKPATEQLG